MRRIISSQTKDVRRGVAGRVGSLVVAQWCDGLLTPARSAPISAPRIARVC
jgi:hypothetical protein